MTRAIGAKQAKEVADNHEDKSEGPAAEKRMDESNNSYGRKVGGSAKSDLAAKIACHNAARSGKLKVL